MKSKVCSLFDNVENLMAKKESENFTPLKSIRRKCLECVGNFKAIKNCMSYDCALHSYRSGHNFKRRGIGVRANLFRAKGRQLSGQYFKNSGILKDDLILQAG